MIKRHLRLLLMACLLLPISNRQAQIDAFLTREGDERATTREERQQELTRLSIAAHQLLDAGDDLRAARFLNRAGRLQIELNRSQDAIATYQKALTLLKQRSDTSIKVDTLNGLSSGYNHLSKCDKAHAFIQQAITLSEQIGYIAGKAEALLTLSDCQNYGDHALALKTAQEALALWQSLNHKRGIANSYTAIGDYQLAQDNLAEATHSYETALSLGRELNLADEQAEALIGLGYVEYRKGAWQNVFAFLTQAQDLLDEKAEPYKMGQINAGLADSFIESGLPEIGLAKYLQALENYRQTKNPQGLVSMGLGIGISYYILGNYKEAEVSLQHTLKDAEFIGEVKIAALCNDSLGQTFTAIGNPAAALHHFGRALELYTQAASPMEAARVRALIGRVYQDQGKVEQARAYYQKALNTFRALSDQVNQAATLYALGGLELRQRNLNRAEDYLHQSIEVTENMLRFSTSRDLTAAFSATVYDRYEKYIECLMHQGEVQAKQNFIVRAFEISEASRARSLAELLQATHTNLAAGLDPKLAERDKFLRQKLKVKEDDKVMLLSGNYRKEDMVALDAELARLKAEYQQMGETIRARYPAYGQITRPTAWDLQQIQEEVIVDNETVLLEYSLGSDKSYVWAVTRDSIKSFNLPAGALIDEAAKKVYKLLAIPPNPNMAKELSLAVQELGQKVLTPVATELNKHRIIIVADGALHYIPFQVLPMPSADDEPLVADYEIINAPSASILGELRREATQRQPSKVLAAFGDPVFEWDYALRKGSKGGEQSAPLQALETAPLQSALRDIELNRDTFDPSVIRPLFYAKRELTNLREATASGEIFVASGFAATREQLLGMDLTQYAILHFATHGLLDPKHPENSGLVLSTVNRKGQAQDGFVRLQDIYGLRAPADLVVLSACQTALGKDVRGEGLLGLTRGFMYAGASSVMASLWKVDDEATAELMRQAYINMLQKGMTPAAALRAAQNSIRQKPEWRSPYYWAGFTLQGEYRQVIKPASARSTAGWYKRIMIAGGLTVLAGAAVWYYRLRLRTRKEII